MWCVSAMSFGGALLFGVTQWLNPKNTSIGQFVGIVILTMMFVGIAGVFWLTLREHIQRLAEDLETDHLFEIQGPIEDKKNTKGFPKC